jgi:hypothetical protein
VIEMFVRREEQLETVCGRHFVIWCDPRPQNGRLAR